MKHDSQVRERSVASDSTDETCVSNIKVGAISEIALLLLFSLVKPVHNAAFVSVIFQQRARIQQKHFAQALRQPYEFLVRAGAVKTVDKTV